MLYSKTIADEMTKRTQDEHQPDWYQMLNKLMCRESRFTSSIPCQRLARTYRVSLGSEIQPEESKSEMEEQSDSCLGSQCTLGCPAIQPTSTGDAKTGISHQKIRDALDGPSPGWSREGMVA